MLRTAVRAPVLATVLTALLAAALCGQNPTATATAPPQGDPLREIAAATTRPAVAKDVAEGIDVEVVDPDGKPVADAVVGVIDFDPAKVSTERQRAFGARVRPYVTDEPRNLAVMLLEFGILYRTDDHGRVRVAPPPRPAGLLAVHADAAAQTMVAPGTRAPQRLQLEAQVFVVAHVEGPDGAPLPDAIVQIGADVEPFVPDAHAQSDRDGNVRLPVRTHLRRQQQDLRVRLPLGRDDDAVQHLHSNALPSAPVALRAPATALLRVTAFGDDDSARDDVDLVLLTPQRAANGQPLPPLQTDASGALFRVALGLEFEVAGRLHRAAGEWHRTARGPARAGETLLVDLRPAMGPPVLAVRLLGIDGKPVAHEDLAMIWSMAAGVEADDVRTDPEGRMQLTLPPSWAPGGVLVFARRGLAEVSEYQGAVSIDLRGKLKTGVNDLGDLQFAEEPVLLSGQAVDETGAPVADLMLTFAPGWSLDANDRSSRSGRQLFRHVVKTDAQGRFTVRDLMTPTRVRLTKCPFGYEVPDLAVGFEPRATDVRVALVRRGRLHVALPGVPANAFVDLQILLAPPGGAPESGPARPLQDADAQLLVPAGVHDVVLRWTDRGEDLLRIAGVEVTADHTTEDPRLAQLDWRERFVLAEVTVVAPDGAPARGVRVVRWSPIDGGHGCSGASTVTDNEGRAILLVPKAGGLLTVDGGDRWRSALVTGVAADRRIELRPWLRAAMALRGELKLPPGASLAFALEAAAAADPTMPPPAPDLVNNDGTSASALLQQPGHRVLVLTANLPQDHRPAVSVVLARQEIAVAETADPQTFTVDATAAMQQQVDDAAKAKQ